MVARMKLTVVWLLVGLVLTGCGGDERDSPASEDTATPSATESAAVPPPPPSPPAVADLKSTCPEVEAALPKYDEPEEFVTAATQVESLSAEGNTETKNALAPVISAMRGLAVTQEINDLLDARAAYRSALDGLATRCAAVGSSALQ